jgi:hypothetical protein
VSTWKVSTKQTGDFDGDFKKISLHQIQISRIITRKSTLELFSRITRRTPVDTGRTRANWQFALGSAPSGVYQRTDKQGQATIGNAVGVLENWVPDEQSGYIVNNVPWIFMLEDGGYGPGPKTTGGFSKQAPQGMVKISMAEWGSILQGVKSQYE